MGYDVMISNHFIAYDCIYVCLNKAYYKTTEVAAGGPLSIEQTRRPAYVIRLLYSEAQGRTGRCCNEEL